MSSFPYDGDVVRPCLIIGTRLNSIRDSELPQQLGTFQRDPLHYDLPIPPGVVHSIHALTCIVPVTHPQVWDRVNGDITCPKNLANGLKETYSVTQAPS